MKGSQFAIYQVRKEPEFRQYRSRSYEELMENKLRVISDNYEEVFIGFLSSADTLESIRDRFQQNKVRRFHGHSVGTSDVIVLNREGVVTSYYVNKDKFIVIPGFFRLNSSSTLITMDTDDFHVEGKSGTWLAADEVIVDGKVFFLMEHTTYGSSAASIIVSAEGNLVADQIFNGFDELAIGKIKEFLNPPISQPTPVQGKPEMEHWQKFYENGEYARSGSPEATAEANYSMIDGRYNNMKETPQTAVYKPKPLNQRVSVLARLRQKQAAIAQRSGPPVQEQDMERNRK